MGRRINPGLLRHSAAAAGGVFLFSRRAREKRRDENFFGAEGRVLPPIIVLYVSMANETIYGGVTIL